MQVHRNALWKRHPHTSAHFVYSLHLSAFGPVLIYSQSECDEVTDSAILGSFTYLFFKALVMCWASASRESIEQSMPEYLFDW